MFNTLQETPERLLRIIDRNMDAQPNMTPCNNQQPVESKSKSFDFFGEKFFRKQIAYF